MTSSLHGQDARATFGRPFGGKVKSSTQSALIGKAPDGIDGFDEGLGSFGRRKKNPASLGFFRDQTSLMEPVQMFDSGGLVDTARGGDLVDAERRTAHQQPDDFQPPVIGQPRHHARPPAFTCSHIW